MFAAQNILDVDDEADEGTQMELIIFCVIQF